MRSGFAGAQGAWMPRPCGRRAYLEVEMAGKAVRGPVTARLGIFRATARDGKRAAGVEMAAAGRRHRRGHIAFKDDALALGARVGQRGRRNKRPRVGMAWTCE